MKKSKRILGLVLAAVMLVSVFTVFASALSYEADLNQGSFKFILTADKTVVNPGDVVTFSLAIDDKGAASDLGAWQNYVLYNDTQLSPASTVSTEFREYTNDAATWLKQTSTINFDMPAAALNRVYPQMTEEEQAYYNHMMMFTGVVDSSLGAVNLPGSGWDPSSADVPQMTFKMKVSESVQPGDEIWFGMHEAPYQVNMAYLGYCGAGRIPTTELDCTESMVKLTVAAAGPAVALDKRQINMELTEDGTDVTGNFAFRAISTITDADWDEYFANTGVADATENAIQAVGIVAADKSTFSMEAAQAAAEANYAEPTTETPDYKVAWTNYIQKTGDDAAAYFGARVDTTKDTCADLSYIGVVAYLDGEGALQFLYYDAADTVDLKTDYETNKNEYLGWLASQA